MIYYMKYLVLFLILVFLFKWNQTEGLYDINKLRSNAYIPVISNIKDVGITTNSLMDKFNIIKEDILSQQIKDLSNNLAYTKFN